MMSLPGLRSIGVVFSEPCGHSFLLNDDASEDLQKAPLIQRQQDGLVNLGIEKDTEPVEVVLQSTQSQRPTSKSGKKLKRQLHSPIKQKDQFCVDLAQLLTPLIDTLNHVRGSHLLPGLRG